MQSIHSRGIFRRILASPGMKVAAQCRTGPLAPQRTLDQLLQFFESSQACDPRDKIYAVLGLAHDIPSGAIIVDYDRSILKVKMDVIWFYQCKNSSRPKFMSHLCHLMDNIVDDGLGPDWPQRERLFRVGCDKPLPETTPKLIAHLKRRLSLVKAQRNDEAKWKEARDVVIHHQSPSNLPVEVGVRRIRTRFSEQIGRASCRERV